MTESVSGILAKEGFQLPVPGDPWAPLFSPQPKAAACPSPDAHPPPEAILENPGTEGLRFLSVDLSINKPTDSFVVLFYNWDG